MTCELLLETRSNEMRVARLEDGVLVEMTIEKTQTEAVQMGDMYIGRVENRLPGMQSAFIDIGFEKNAFLFLTEGTDDKNDYGVHAAAVQAQRAQRSRVTVGQEMLVQVIKVPGGDKGPRVVSQITLPGRLCVLMPTTHYIGISRRIECDEERARLRAIGERIQPDGMGFIIRTAAEGCTEAELQADLESVYARWQRIEQRARYQKAPARVYRDQDLMTRVIRDMLGGQVSALRTDDEATFATAQRIARELAPDQLDKICYCPSDVPLFTRYSVESQWANAQKRRVWLKSGGYLVFDRTEAMTVIDVNTGKYIGKRSLEETILRTNQEALQEIARQLRLRDIGGIIIIDLIDVADAEQRRGLVTFFKAALAADAAHSRVVGLTELMLLQVTRKKRQATEEKETRTCPLCGGRGVVFGKEAEVHEH